MADETIPEGEQGWPPPPVPGPTSTPAPGPPPAPGSGWDPRPSPPPPRPGAGWDPRAGWGPPQGYPPTPGYGPPQGYPPTPGYGPPQGYPPPGPPFGGGWAAPPYQGQAPGAWPYPPYQDPYSTGYGQPGPKETEKLSIWSLVLGIGSFVVLPFVAAIAAIITGTKGKKAIRNSGGTKTGAGMATAGQVLGVANIVLTVLVGVLIAIGANFVSHHRSYTSLQTGDCFNTGGVGNLVTTVACAKPHQEEAVGTFEYQAGGSAPWPGPSGFATTASDQCSTLAVSYVGTPNSSLRLVYVYPSRQAWDNGTRKIVCSVRNRDGTSRVGSVRGGLGPSTNG